jgi:hypothetical protein
LPSGSNRGDRGQTRCPSWPPDLFAVAAKLAEISGFYTHIRFTAPWRENEYVCDRAYVRSVYKLGAAWANSAKVPAEVQRLWTNLLKYRHKPVVAPGFQKWHIPAMKLLAVADQASEGMGFGTLGRRSAGLNPFQRLIVDEHYNFITAGTTQALPHLFSSLCVMVSPDIACVQPKTNTPTVGCTLRSLSHHLALLPPVGTVESIWAIARTRAEYRRPFNLLLIPFPYVISGSDFRAQNRGRRRERYFRVEQGWLPTGDAVALLSEFTLDLIKEAKRELGEIHAVVFPEAALRMDLANEIADRVAAEERGLELFVAGAMHDAEAANRHSFNVAVAHSYYRGEASFHWAQTKHHRWCLEREQIRRYHLGHVLDPEELWWEQIDVDDRECFFTVIRPGASLAVLICEDLARFDPVLPILNSVGPNLVIALLMDGPQMEQRWPGRYATVLADDPGSSVLTFTCLGLVRRSSMPARNEDRRIGLWKQAGGTTQELELPVGCHALALTLSISEVEQFTLDGRSDGGSTKSLKLFAVRGVKASKSHPGVTLD